MIEDRGGNPALMSLIGKTHLTWKRYIQKALVGQEITLKQYYVLLQLAGNDFLYPSQVAEMLFCDRPTASVVIRNMEKHAWLTREQDPENRKQIRLRITDDGQDKLNHIRDLPELKKRFGSDPLDCLSGQEAEILTTLLQKVYEQLVARSEE